MYVNNEKSRKSRATYSSPLALKLKRNFPKFKPFDSTQCKRQLLFFSLLFLIFFFQAGNVYAAALTSVADVPWSSDVSTSGKHTINFTTVTSIPADGKIIITFPSGFTVSGATFDSWSGIDGGRSLSVLGQVITITRDNTGTSSTAGAKYMVLDNITNHSTATTYTVTVETQDSSSTTLDGPTTSSNFTITNTSDGLDTSAPWPIWLHDQRNSATSTNSGPSYPAIRWRFLASDSADNHRSVIQGSDGTIYYSSATILYAINEDGSTKWSTENAHGINIGTALTVSGRIYTYGSGVLVARDTSDGSIIWSYTTGLTSSYWNSFNISPDGTVVIADNSGVEGVNSDGTRKFLTTGSIGRDTTPAIDSSGIIYLTDDGSTGGYYPDGKVKYN